MKQLSLLSKTFVLIIAMVVLAIPARADRVVTQQQFGKQTIEVAADEVITFYDMNSYQGLSSSSSNNSQSLTVFKPAAGKAIQLNFERLDVRNDDKSSRAVIIGATQKGKTQYMKLTINVDNTTGIEGVIVENGKTVESRQYVNVAGQVSDRPFSGMNIIVTRYTDGTTSSVKAIVK